MLQITMLDGWQSNTHHRKLFHKKLPQQWARWRHKSPTKTMSWDCWEETDGESTLLHREILCTTSRNNPGLFVGPSV